MNVNKIEFSKDTEDLKKLILENPDLPIVVLTNYEVIGDGYGWWYGQNISYSIEKIIEVEKYGDWNTFYEVDDLKEYLENELADMEEYCAYDDEEFEELVQDKLKEYEPLWTECIVIKSDI